MSTDATKAASEGVFKRAYNDVARLYPTCRAVIVAAVVPEDDDLTAVHVAVALPSDVRECLGEAAIVSLNVAIEAVIAEHFNLGLSDEGQS